MDAKHARLQEEDSPHYVLFLGRNGLVSKWDDYYWAWGRENTGWYFYHIIIQQINSQLQSYQNDDILNQHSLLEPTQFHFLVGHKMNSHLEAHLQKVFPLPLP